MNMQKMKKLLMGLMLCAFAFSMVAGANVANAKMTALQLLEQMEEAEVPTSYDAKAAVDMELKMKGIGKLLGMDFSMDMSYFLDTMKIKAIVNGKLSVNEMLEPSFEELGLKSGTYNAEVYTELSENEELLTYVKYNDQWVTESEDMEGMTELVTNTDYSRLKIFAKQFTVTETDTNYVIDGNLIFNKKNLKKLGYGDRKDLICKKPVNVTVVVDKATMTVTKETIDMKKYANFVLKQTLKADKETKEMAKIMKFSSFKFEIELTNINQATEFEIPEEARGAGDDTEEDTDCDCGCYDCDENCDCDCDDCEEEDCDCDCECDGNYEDDDDDEE